VRAGRAADPGGGAGAARQSVAAALRADRARPARRAALRDAARLRAARLPRRDAGAYGGTVAAPLTLDDHPARLTAAAFADHLRRDRLRSAHTVRAYVATAHRLVAFLGQHRGGPVDGAVLASIEATDLRAYLARRRGETGLSN